jgi:hypothetical protein
VEKLYKEEVGAFWEVEQRAREIFGKFFGEPRGLLVADDLPLR